MSADPQLPADEVTERIRHLRGMLADLTGYIEREAQELAAPMIRDAEARCRLAVTEARGEVQRKQDVNHELGRRLRALERRSEEAEGARHRLAAALGEPAGALPLSYFVGMAETVLAEAQKKEREDA